jgi:hypothetical protein
VSHTGCGSEIDEESGLLYLVRPSSSSMGSYHLTTLKLLPNYAAQGADFDATIKKMSISWKQEMQKDVSYTIIAVQWIVGSRLQKDRLFQIGFPSCLEDPAFKLILYARLLLR